MEFKAKIWKTGNTFVLSVPKAFVDNDLVKKNTLYTIRLKEAKKDEAKTTI